MATPVLQEEEKLGRDVVLDLAQWTAPVDDFDEPGENAGSEGVFVWRCALDVRRPPWLVEDLSDWTPAFYLEFFEG